MRKQDKLKVIQESNQRLEEKFLKEKAIGFKTADDNRDKDTKSERGKLGYKPSKDEMDWEKMGFKSNEDYKKFLDTKMKSLLDKIKNDPELLSVFKRLHDK
jgi:GTP-dependent phosphoenolpyruvate carboxykinase